MANESEPQTKRFRYKLSNWEIEVVGDEELIKEVVVEIKKKELPPYGRMEPDQVAASGLYS